MEWTKHDPATGRVIGRYSDDRTHKDLWEKRTNGQGHASAAAPGHSGLTEFRESRGGQAGPSDAELDSMIELDFTRLGLSESAAAIAAAGRGCRPRSKAERTASNQDQLVEAILQPFREVRR